MDIFDLIDDSAAADESTQGFKKLINSTLEKEIENKPPCVASFQVDGCWHTTICSNNASSCRIHYVIVHCSG